jgi:hypothetical protein
MHSEIYAALQMAAAKLIRERRRRRLEAAGLQIEQPLPVPAGTTIAETLRYCRARGGLAAEQN